MSTRSGSITFRRGSWYARLIYVDPATGQRRDLWKACESKVAARQQKDAWLREIDDSGAESLLKSRATSRSSRNGSKQRTSSRRRIRLMARRSTASGRCARQRSTIEP
jgi:hypothetical protein